MGGIAIKIGNLTIGRSSGGASVGNGPPTNLTLTLLSSTSIRLNWTDGTCEEDGVSIERKEEGGSFTEITTVTDTFTYTDTGLTPFTTYYYKVREYIDDTITRIKPILISAVVEDVTPTKVELTFSQNLRTTSLPSVSAFSLPGKTISTVEISGAKVTLTVTADYVQEDTILVSYTTPATNMLKGLVGCVHVDSFTNQAVTNNIAFIPVTFVSVAVANATPTKVVLTYSRDLDTGSIPDTSAFTVTDYTVSSVNVTGATVELTLNTAVIYFDILHVTYTVPGSNKIKANGAAVYADALASTLITNNVLDDGNTVAWYLASDTATITKDGDNHVTRWNDKLGSGRDLATVGDVPHWQQTGSKDSVYFDGANDFIQGTFTLIQPEFCYVVIYADSFTANDRPFDGKTSSGGGIRQIAPSPNIQANAGAASSSDANLTIDAWHIVRVLFNGANSKLIVDANAPVTGNFGANDMAGLTMASNGSANFANVAIAEFIISKVSDSSDYETSLYNILKRRHSL